MKKCSKRKQLLNITCRLIQVCVCDDDVMGEGVVGGDGLLADLAEEGQLVGPLRLRQVVDHVQLQVNVRSKFLEKKQKISFRWEDQSSETV